jgi:hypothetical protein
MARITTIPLFKNLSLSAGDSGTSDSIDLRDAVQQGFFSLAHRISIGTAATCGTTVFTYKGCSMVDGTYITPAAAIAIGTAGSHGTYGTANIWTFEPELMPFMKIVATQTGAGTAGANTKIVAAELIVQ